MKKLSLSIIVLFAVLTAALFAQTQPATLPRIAVFEFSTNVDNQELKADAAAVRNMTESELSATGKFRIMTRTEIDKLLSNQRFQASSISSAENIEILKMEQISYIITGTVNIMRGDYAITLSVFSVSSGQISHSDNIRIRASEDFYDGVINLVKKFTAGMSAGEGGEIVQGQGGRSGANITGATAVYKVGDFGPAGGIIFYDKGTFSAGWRYLEAAPAETEFSAQWGAYQQDVAGTGTAIGTGKRNTQLIVEHLRSRGENGRAASLCASLDFDGFKDWFLPSKDELDLMYKNLKQKGLGGFSNGYYWSSSQDNITFAWVRDFGNGRQGNYPKSYASSVRAIRAF